MRTPAIAVVMPVFNGEPFVRDAIASILEQTCTDYEFVIINDGSTDGTPLTVASFADPRIRILTNRSRQGIAAALNQGLAAARAPLVARHDADDIAFPQRLEKQLAFLRSNAEVALVGTQVQVLDPHGRASRPPGWRRALTHEGIEFQSLFENPFIHSSVMFRRAVVWDELGGYDPAFVSAEDFELWSRVAGRYRVRNLPQRLAGFRMHAASTAAHFGSDHIARCSMIIDRNLRRLLAPAEVPARWSSTLGSLCAGATADIDGTELLATLATIHDGYLVRHPEQERDPEIRRTLAAQLGRIACLLVTRQRAAAVRAWGRAARLDAREASAFATRFFPLFVFGDRVRSLRKR